VNDWCQLDCFDHSNDAIDVHHYHHFLLLHYYHHYFHQQQVNLVVNVIHWCQWQLQLRSVMMVNLIDYYYHHHHYYQ
jgi:hypothetical protein